MDYVVEREPVVRRDTSGGVKADLKIVARVANRAQTIISDLRVAEADSVSAIALTSAEETDPQTEKLLQKHHNDKMKHYTSRGVIGVVPWIITSLGCIHSTFEDWILGLKPYAKHAVMTACCKRLVSCRAWRVSHKPY